MMGLEDASLKVDDLRGLAYKTAFADATSVPRHRVTFDQARAAILRDLAGVNLVGGDVVGISPPYDTTGATHDAYEPLCLYGWTRQ